MHGTLEPHLIQNGLTTGEWLWLAGMTICFVLATYVVIEFIKIIKRRFKSWA